MRNVVMSVLFIWGWVRVTLGVTLMNTKYSNGQKSVTIS